MTLKQAFEKYDLLLSKLDTLTFKYTNLLNEKTYSRLLKNRLDEDIENQKQELVEKIYLCVEEIQTHVLYMLQLLEKEVVVDFEDLNTINRDHINAMSTYKGLMYRAKLFPDDQAIQDAAQVLKDCKNRLEHNIKCYNEFLASVVANVQLYTTSEALQIAKKEEDALDL